VSLPNDGPQAAAAQAQAQAQQRAQKEATKMTGEAAEHIPCESL